MNTQTENLRNNVRLTPVELRLLGHIAHEDYSWVDRDDIYDPVVRNLLQKKLITEDCDLTPLGKVWADVAGF